MEVKKKGGVGLHIGKRKKREMRVLGAPSLLTHRRTGLTTRCEAAAFWLIRKVFLTLTLLKKRGRSEFYIINGSTYIYY